MSERLPPWLKIKPPSKDYSKVKNLLRSNNLTTVCVESLCPNMADCWDSGVATFMLLGKVCTRNCRFCNTLSGRYGEVISEEEIQKIINSLKELKIFDYIVLTSVDRDDLEDLGSGYIAKVVNKIKKEIKDIKIEVLIPDFSGKQKFLDKVIIEKPEVIAHNIETTKSLTPFVRDWRAKYDQSLNVLEYVKKKDPRIITKSSIMLGLGERKEDIISSLKDLKKIGVSIVTIGQYLRPSEKNIKVLKYYTPEEFSNIKDIAKSIGICVVEAGPFIRSSYKAKNSYTTIIQGNEKSN